MSEGYEVAHLDELEELPVHEWMWRPIRRRFGINAFGTNAWTGDKGRRILEEHKEEDGHEEMYVVLRGRAIFTLGDDELTAEPGTIVFVRPGTRRGAVADEDGTAILAVGAKPGVVFEPSRWEDMFAAFAYAEKGEVERARPLIRETVERYPEEWHPNYNAACFEARWGNRDQAFAYLEQAVAKGGDEARELAAKDSDFDSIRDEERFSTITRKPDPAGASS